MRAPPSNHPPSLIPLPVLLLPLVPSLELRQVPVSQMEPVRQAARCLQAFHECTFATLLLLPLLTLVSSILTWQPLSVSSALPLRSRSSSFKKVCLHLAPLLDLSPSLQVSSQCQMAQVRLSRSSSDSSLIPSTSHTYPTRVLFTSKQKMGTPSLARVQRCVGM